MKASSGLPPQTSVVLVAISGFCGVQPRMVMDVPAWLPVDPDEPPKEQAADYQLLRAADLIRGISLYSGRAN